MSHDYLTFEGCEGGSWLEPFGIPLVWKGGFWYTCYRVLKGGCPRGGGNWGTLRIPAGKIGEPNRED